MKINFVILPLAAIGMQACIVASNATLFDPSVHLAKTCADAVKLYTSADRVQKPYREVALIRSIGETNTSDEADLLKSMRKKAASVGANGLILEGIDEPNAITRVAGAVAKAPVDRRGRATAIFVSGDSAQTLTTCAQKK